MSHEPPTYIGPPRVQQTNMGVKKMVACGLQESMLGMRIRVGPGLSFGSTCGPIEALRGDFNLLCYGSKLKLRIYYAVEQTSNDYQYRTVEITYLVHRVEHPHPKVNVTIHEHVAANL